MSWLWVVYMAYTEDTENVTMYDMARKHMPDGLSSFDDTQVTHDNQTSRPKRRRLERKHATNEGEVRVPLICLPFLYELCLWNDTN